jgi:hypothetical protein
MEGVMGVLEFLGLRSKALPRASCAITAEGVRAGLGRVVPLDEVDRFEVERRDPNPLYDEDDSDEHRGGFRWSVVGGGYDSESPYEQLVLLTRTGNAIPIPTSRNESLGNVALQLNNQLAALRDE